MKLVFDVECIPQKDRQIGRTKFWKITLGRGGGARVNRQGKGNRKKEKCRQTKREIELNIKRHK